MKIDIYNLRAEKTGKADLSATVFGQPINQSIISQSVRIYLSNHRKARARAKTRAEVAGTTKKIWAQKGTGRARHGDRRAPIFVGGGSAHGPQGDQNYKLKMPRKMAKVALNSVLSQFAKDKSIICIDGFEKIRPKTKLVSLLLSDLEKQDRNLANSKKIGLIVSPSDKNIKLSSSNLPKVNLINVYSLNPYKLLSNNFLIFNKSSLDFINNTKQ